MLNGSTPSATDKRVHPRISIVVSVFNSESKVPELYCRIKFTMESMGAPFEIILVEDCSSDDSWRVLGALARFDERVTALQLMRHSGKTAAMLAGMSWAKGDLIVTLGDDLKHAPEDIPLLVHRLLRDEELDVVTGSPAPAAEKARAALWGERARRLTNASLARLRKKAVAAPRENGLSYTSRIGVTGFRVMRRQVADALVTLNAPHLELNGMIRSITGRVAGETVRAEAPPAPVKGLRARLRALALWLRGGLWLWGGFGAGAGRPARPLRLVALAGAAGFAASAAAACGAFGWALGGRRAVAEADAVALFALGLGGFNFLALSLIAEHLDRVSRIWSGTSRWVVRRVLRHAAPLTEAAAPPLAERTPAE